MSIVVNQCGNFCWQYSIPLRLKAQVGKSCLHKSLKTREPNDVFRLAKMFNFAGYHLAVTLDRADISLVERAAALKRFDAWCDEAINGWQPKRELGEPATPRRDQAATISTWRTFQSISSNPLSPRTLAAKMAVILPATMQAAKQADSRVIIRG